ncbi:MAG: hypothetical protein HY905_20100 [Deltaproteobacteria bacterium]|nr:hypothetical protein [Deltaproteobacteria bacterium]
MMDERRTGEETNHLDVESIGLAADEPGELAEGARRHLELCAVCRAEVERQRSVARMVAELGEAYRAEAPPGWPAAAAVEARARETEPGSGWLERLGLRLGIRARSLATAVAVFVGVMLAAAAAVWMLSRPPEPRGGGPAPVAQGPGERQPGAVVPPPAPDAGAVAELQQPEAGVPVPAVPAHPPVSSSIVAMTAGRDVSYVMMNVPYEGGTAAVIWLSALPASGG